MLFWVHPQAARRESIIGKEKTSYALLFNGLEKLFQQWQVEIIFWYTMDQVIVYVLTFPEDPLSRSSVIMLTRPPGQTDLEEMILFLRGCSLMFLFYSKYKCPRRLWHTRALVISKSVNNPESAEANIFSFIVIRTTLFPYLHAWLASRSLCPLNIMHIFFLVCAFLFPCAINYTSKEEQDLTSLYFSYFDSEITQHPYSRYWNALSESMPVVPFSEASCIVDQHFHRN